MSLRPEPIEPVPEETARIARLAFPHGSIWLRLRDELGTIYEDDAFAPLFPSHGRPAEAPWRLALVSVLQFAEGLSDRQAAEAVRARLDWKYLLGWNWMTQASISRCSASSLLAWLAGTPSCFSCRPSWHTARRAAGSRPAGRSGRTRRMSWLPFGRSTASRR